MLRCIRSSGRWPAVSGQIAVLVLGLGISASAHAAIWPDQFGAHQKVGSKEIAVTDAKVWEEYGLEATEQAQYSSEARRFTASAWRLKDSTDALAVFQWQRPSGAKPSPLGKLAVATADGVYLAHGNYVFLFAGYVPDANELQEMFDALPRLEQSALPVLPDYLPSDDRVPDSERYVIGPVSLQKFQPQIPPSVAAFRFGVEGQLGKFRTRSGNMLLAIFNYPTPALAREQATEFQKLNGAMVKRTGPLVAVILSPPDPDAAERVLGKVNYQAAITWNEKVPGNQARSFAQMILSIFALAGILLAFCLVAGVAFGGLRILARKFGHQDAQDPMILLHLSDK